MAVRTRRAAAATPELGIVTLAVFLLLAQLAELSLHLVVVDALRHWLLVVENAQTLRKVVLGAIRDRIFLSCMIIIDLLVDFSHLFFHHVRLTSLHLIAIKAVVVGAY